AFGFSCLYNVTAELMHSSIANYVGCALLVILSALLLPIATKLNDASEAGSSGVTADSMVNDNVAQLDSSQPTNDTNVATAKLTGKQKALSAAKQLWMPLVGALLATFIFGLTWDPTASSMPISNEFLTVVLRSLAGPLITVAIIMGAVIHKPDSSVLRVVQSALFPIAIAFLLALPTINSDDLYVSALTGLLDKASFSVIIVSIWTAITNTSRTAQIPAHILLPLCLGVLGGSSFLGLNLIHVIGTNGQTLCLVLFAIYLALIATSFAINTRTEKASVVAENPSPHKSIQQRSDEIAAEYKLSPREIEVLYLLGRGYNHGYIAKQLFISENTVRTHVRHI
ncbi:MAG: LuxR C-terminal-related transcriptional regulator, partial [Raoultibacter sp.]